MEKSYTTEHEWLERIQSWRDSGLSQKAWCQQNSVRASQFGYWKRKLDTTPRPTSQQPAAFVPVATTPHAATTESALLTVSLPNGIQVSGIDQDNLTLVQKLVGVLS